MLGEVDGLEVGVSDGLELGDFDGLELGDFDGLKLSDLGVVDGGFVGGIISSHIWYTLHGLSLSNISQHSCELSNDNMGFVFKSSDTSTAFVHPSLLVISGYHV